MAFFLFYFSVCSVAIFVKRVSKQIACNLISPCPKNFSEMESNLYFYEVFEVIRNFFQKVSNWVLGQRPKETAETVPFVPQDFCAVRTL